VLISSYCPRGAVVLDFCSGRSGDMNKLQAVGVSHVVSADFARDSLVDAAVRYNNVRSKNKHMCSYEFIHANCFEVCFVIKCMAVERCVVRSLVLFFSHQADLPAALPSTTQFDFAQCQFAIHYAFDSEQHVRRALQNVTERLKPGAFFVGTTTDSRVLIKKLRSSGELQIGNSACRVTWLGKETASGHAELDPVYGSLGIKKSDPFGYKYIFKLEDAIDGVAESLIDFDVFERIALEYGLQCRLSSNFHEFFAQACNEPQFRDKLFLPNAGIFGPDGRMPADTWDVACTSVFVA
jgi:mRNA (guanine-N7-)-methyltransferase